MTTRAFAAVIEARVHSQRHTLVYGLVARASSAPSNREVSRRPHFFVPLVGIVAALQQGPGRFADLDLCEESAPLFGRELARAKALVPCAIAVIAAAAYCATASLAGWRDIPITLAYTIAAAVPATLTALCATLRIGPARRVYCSWPQRPARSWSRSWFGRAFHGPPARLPRWRHSSRYGNTAKRSRATIRCERLDRLRRRGRGELFQHRTIELRHIFAATRECQFRSLTVGWSRYNPPALRMSSAIARAPVS